eukprot:g2195.t1
MDVLRGCVGCICCPSNRPLTLQEMFKEFKSKHNFPFVEDLCLGTKLGNGAHGEVFLATMGGMGGARVAAKRPSEEVVKVLRRGGEDARKRFIVLSKEYINLAKVGYHQNVLRFFGVGIVRDVPYLVTELAEMGSLQEKIERGDATDAEKIKWALDVARGMSHIHKEGFIHRDLKPDNVLLKRDGNVAVADLGITREAPSVDSASPSFGTFTMVDGGKSEGESMTRRVGTYMYMAPEICSGDYNDKVDVWSFGILLFKLFRLGNGGPRENDLPFFDKESGTRVRLPLIPHYVSEGWVRLVSLPQDASVPRSTAFIAKLVENCLKFDPGQRLTFAKIVDMFYTLDCIIPDDVQGGEAKSSPQNSSSPRGNLSRSDSSSTLEYSSSDGGSSDSETEQLRRITSKVFITLPGSHHDFMKNPHEPRKAVRQSIRQVLIEVFKSLNYEPVTVHGEERIVIQYENEISSPIERQELAVRRNETGTIKHVEIHRSMAEDYVNEYMDEEQIRDTRANLAESVRVGLRQALEGLVKNLPDDFPNVEWIRGSIIAKFEVPTVMAFALQQVWSLIVAHRKDQIDRKFLDELIGSETLDFFENPPTSKKKEDKVLAVVVGLAKILGEHHFPLVKDLRLEDKLGDGALGEVFLATMGGMGGARVAAKRPSDEVVSILMRGG